jgi:hypothetical protein
MRNKVKYDIIIYWSEADRPYVAEVPELPTAETDRLLGWGPRCINPAAQYHLNENSQANCLGLNGSHPYAFSHILVTPKTKRFTFG